MYSILGAGLSGLSIADHLSKDGVPFILFEGKGYGGGHIHSEVMDGFTWDEGPHVSFTFYDYVKKYFSENCDDQFLEYPTIPTNYFHGSWIAHPAQANMYAVPDPLRSEAIADVVEIRKSIPEGYQPENYQEWIDYAFGKTFAEAFPAIYTKKYWTTTPENLTTDWIGKRIYFPEVKDMIESAAGPLQKQTHYISKIRYPKSGGFYTYIKSVEKRLPVQYNKMLQRISFVGKELLFADGSTHIFDKLISTIPLPLLIEISDAPANIKQCAKLLKCSQVLLINIVADHPPAVPNQWIYVYDEDFYSTRINFTDLLSPQNGIPGKAGIQVEVYFSDYHPLNEQIDEIEKAVIKELITMGLLESENHISGYHHKWVQWANVIFDNPRKQAQEQIFTWLKERGMAIEADELNPMTDWNEKQPVKLGTLILAGRFAQWKYFWTDDCVMRAKFIADNIRENSYA